MNKYLNRILISGLIMLFAVSACSPEMTEPVQLSEVTLEPLPATKTASPMPSVTPDVEETLPQQIPANTEIIFWHPWSGEVANLVEDLIIEFNSINEWGIKVNGEVHSDEIVFIDDLTQAIAKSEIPEVIAAPDYFLQELAKDEISFQDLNKFLNSSEYGYSQEKIESFQPVFWSNQTNFDGRLSVPAYRSGNYIFYNQTWANELGFAQFPTTPVEFQAQACKAGGSYLLDKDFNNDGLGGWIYTYDPNSVFSWLKVFSGGNEDGTLSMDKIENTEGGEYLYQLFFDDCAWIGRQQHPFEYFAKRQALFYSGKIEDILIQEFVNSVNNTDDKWSVFPYPSTLSKPILLVDGDSYAITTDDENKALAAWIFISWMLEPENQAKMVQVSGSYPLSTTALDFLSDFMANHPVWVDALQYLPLSQNVPVDPLWGPIKKVLGDLSWKMIQFTTAKEDIPGLFLDAQNLLGEISQ